MSGQRPATLAYDVPARPPYGGSCGLVARALRLGLRAAGYAVTEHYVPLTDKVSPIALPGAGRRARGGVDLMFEELLPRCATSSAARVRPRVAYFNLPYLRALEEQCDADGLIFASEYLRACFRAAAEAAGLRVPPTAVIHPALPILSFPRGYPSGGGVVELRELRALAREAHLGHALRPGKSDPFATLAILHHLSRLAARRGTRPFRLLLPESDVHRYVACIAQMPIPEATLEALISVGHLTNGAVLQVMRHAPFALCYDTFLEGFGFYPVESVYAGSHVFTNGSGNVRHLLPPGQGIEVQETLDMHFGSARARVAAYAPVAERIFAVVTHGAPNAACTRGAATIRRRYTQEVLDRQLARFLAGVEERWAGAPGARSTRGRGPVAGVSPGRDVLGPYLRLADWERGRFVTDRGPLRVHPATARSWRLDRE